jgi:hypothetical protein
MADKPVHKVIMGPIKGLVWRNETKRGPRLNATFERLYKDEDDKWQSSGSFGPEHCLVLAKVTEKCADWMYNNNPAKDNPSDEN